MKSIVIVIALTISLLLDQAPAVAQTEFVQDEVESVESELRRLAISDNDTLAVQAAWELVKLRIKKDSDLGSALLSNSVSEFAGFLSGRAKILLPVWWSTCLADGKLDRNKEWIPGPIPLDAYKESTVESLKCPQDATLSCDSGTITFSSEGRSSTVPDSILNRDDNGFLWGAISGCFHKDSCILTHHDDGGGSHFIAKVDVKTGETAWRSRARGWMSGGASGLSRSRVSISVLETAGSSLVCVFGLGSGGFYCHTFDLQNGETKFLFSSAHKIDDIETLPKNAEMNAGDGETTRERGMNKNKVPNKNKVR